MDYSIVMPVKYYTQDVHDFLKPYYEKGLADLYRLPNFEMKTIIDKASYALDFMNEKVRMMQINFHDFERQYTTVNEKFMKDFKIPVIIQEGQGDSGEPALEHFIYPGQNIRTVQVNTNSDHVIEAGDIIKIVNNGGTMQDIEDLLLGGTDYKLPPIEVYAASDEAYAKYFGDDSDIKMAEVLRLLDTGVLTEQQAMAQIKQIKKGGN